MTHRLEATARRVTFSVEADLQVGYHDCEICGTECPPPTTEQLVAAARAAYRYSCGADYDPHWTHSRIASGELPASAFLWPSDRPNAGNISYLPTRWKHVDGQLICPKCHAAIEDVIAKLRKPMCEP